MRVVYDTNVYVSGSFWEGPPKELIKAAINREVELVVSEAILEELSKVLQGSLGVTSDETSAIIRDIVMISTVAYPRISLNVVRDKKDNRVLECAVEGRCDYLVTGDSDLLVLRRYNDVRIVTPKEFLEILRGA